MKLHLIAVGHKMPGWIDAGYDDYARRMPPDMPLVLAAIKPGHRVAGEDGAQIAQTVAVVDMASGEYTIEDTTQTVSIPGTSYTHLRDAYPFGGAEAVAAALDGGAPKPGTAWVDVSQAAWEKLLAKGVDVKITEPFETFDEKTEVYTQFAKGEQRVAAVDLRQLLNGAAYLGTGARTDILDTVAVASLRALTSATPGSGIETDLAAAQWTAFSKALAAKLATVQ